MRVPMVGIDVPDGRKMNDVVCERGDDEHRPSADLIDDTQISNALGANIYYLEQTK